MEQKITDHYTFYYKKNANEKNKMINRMQVTFYCDKMSVVKSKINFTSLKITVPIVYN